MAEIRLDKKLGIMLDNFIQGLERIYGENLVSVILYGSASSGEFVENHSDVNLLVVLKDADLENLACSRALIRQGRFRYVRPLFFTQGYIQSSSDVFPIEFLDMKDNYSVLRGQDVLKGVVVDMKNLRFQCEQELKSKLIGLRQLYMARGEDTHALKDSLFKSFTSVLHILRNVMRLEGKEPPYLKQDVLRQVSSEFTIDSAPWEKILAAKNKQVKLNSPDTKDLFAVFVKDLEKIVDIVDRL